MRNRKPIAKKVLSATATGLQFAEEKKFSTNTRINQILNLLQIDEQVHKFRAIMQEAERRQRNINLSNL